MDKLARDLRVGDDIDDEGYYDSDEEEYDYSEEVSAWIKLRTAQRQAEADKQEAEARSTPFTIPQWLLDRQAARDRAAEESSTKRNVESQKKLVKKQGAILVPKRCEFEGCEKTGAIVTKGACSGCRMVFYCGREHQKADWARHKKDCKHLSKSGLRRKYFEPVKELAKYPIGCFPLPDPQQDAPLACFVCGATPDEVNIGFTECCNVPVCDNEEEYEMFSFSRDHCMRSHSRYTACAFHFNEGHTSNDWRTCGQCKNNFEQDGAARSWFSTNGFCVTPGLETSLPQGSYITQPCSKCNGRITPGHDTVSYSFSDGSAPAAQCGDCSGGGR